jgi:hypothetical protein
MRHFVKPSIIHAANWMAADLRHNITTRSNPSSSIPTRPKSPSSPITRDKVLGITCSIDGIHSETTSLSHDATQIKLFRIPGDTVEPFFSERDTSPTATPMIDETIFSHIHPVHSGSLSPPKNHSSQFEYFGIYEEPPSFTTATSKDFNRSASWSTFPPLRFAVEFWDLDVLREKNRLHSQTIWYAGSLFNVYALVVRKKGTQNAQLGVYLHRQSSVEPIPLMSAASISANENHFSQEFQVEALSQSPTSASSSSGKSPGMSRGPYVPPIDTRAKLSINADGTGTFSRGSSPSISRPDSGSATNSPTLVGCYPPEQPYRDPRPQISAYFTISCASPKGSSITKFSSGPDVFGVGQSWGWKTSSFRSEEYLVHGDGSNGSKKSLRAMVTLGLV